MLKQTRKPKNTDFHIKRRKPISILLFYLILLLVFHLGRAKERKFIRVFFPNGFSITAELAVSDEERQLGLMFREKINSDQGMLFLFKEEGFHSFWMKNMNFPLDIIWLDRDKIIVHIESNVPPCRELPCSSYTPQFPASYVLELKTGSVGKNQLKMYDKLDFVIPPGVKFQ